MKRILIVEDDVVLRRTYEILFEKEGFQVAVADNGLSAWLEIKAQVPDVIVTDISMPGMDGLVLIREVRKEYPRIPLIAISGGQTTRNVDFQPHAEREGVELFFEKPIHNKDLLQAVDDLLAGKHPSQNPADTE